MARGRSGSGSGSMGGANRRMVTRAGRDWAVRKPGASRASSIHSTQGEAIDRARHILGNDGGGELTIQGRDGKIPVTTPLPRGIDAELISCPFRRIADGDLVVAEHKAPQPIETLDTSFMAFTRSGVRSPCLHHLTGRESGRLRFRL